MLMKKRISLAGFSRFIISSIFILPLLVAVQDAEALSQWARKYKVDCSTCHFAFPRVNYFGEQFKRNGYQWPGEPADGDTEAKEKLSKNLFIDNVGNWFGARLSLTPLKYVAEGQKRNGVDEDTINVGNTNWLQFFVGGSIFKDVSIFIEQEMETDGSKTNWFYMNFTNLAGSYANFQIGRLSPVDFTPLSDRLRAWQKSDVMNLKSSGGKGENSQDIRSPRPGIQYYGYQGPFVWFAGVDNGKDSTDTDKDKNYWGGGKLEIPDSVKSAFVGSGIGFHYYQGTDTSGGLGSTATSLQRTNDFRRYTVSADIRYKTDLELQFAYQYGEDENYTLAASPVYADFDGYTATGAYRLRDWYYILQYDRVRSSRIANIDVDKLSPSAWYFLRDNWKVGVATRFDVGDSPVRKHEVALEIETMF
ncbi:MAG: hypothetical protein HY579_01645 [Nitrospinae bacterium]|nr:hypothetical protein [Nitrospinota bacterium]